MVARVTKLRRKHTLVTKCHFCYRKVGPSTPLDSHNKEYLFMCTGGLILQLYLHLDHQAAQCHFCWEIYLQIWCLCEKS